MGKWYKPKNLVKSVTKVVDKAVDTVKDTVKDTYNAAKNVVTGTGHLIAGHHDEAEKDFTKAASSATQAAINVSTGGVAGIVSPSLVEKTGDLTGKAVVKATESVLQPIVSTGEAAYHLGATVVDVAQGDWKDAQKNLAKTAGNLLEAATAKTLNVATGYMGKAVAPKLIDDAGKAGEMLAYYSTGNFNQGSQKLEDLTGWDVDNSKAEAAERAAKAKYQAEVEEANQAAVRNRRANLLALRKALTPSLSRASQGGGGAGYFDEKSQGGITLG